MDSEVQWKQEVGYQHVKPRQVAFEKPVISNPVFQNDTVREGFKKCPLDVEHRDDWKLSESLP